MSEKTGKEPQFEEALRRLEQIVEKLESGGLTLEQAIKAFEEGSRLRKFCEDKLRETERRVEMIIKKETSDGTVETAPFHPADDEGQQDP